jgi:hypothetical protein
MLLLIIIVFQPPFVLFGGIFLVRFSIRNTGLKRLFHLCLLDLDRLESRYVPYDCFFGADTIPLRLIFGI